ncbi:hypothetical protein [Gracilibacillus kekensis]|uniref:DUF4328 domain-containing protein n=1 Tax=Gracilibacillus kekensis TaxID=1027249 RepID=A0A1M7LF30_9BACI|nr:hypothetical protein [Gracilibacillus kekensis]SHM76738.1 hypothetical protein SAMN05216179_1056 [Gracilibacillus kekensis]
MKLNSKSIGKILSVFLWGVIILNGVGLINTYLFAFHYNIYLNIMTFDHFINIFLGVSFLILVILYLIWLYKIHIDLNHFSIQYPISPLAAVLRVIIPIYNLWGMWNVYSTMAKQLDLRFDTNTLANQLRLFIPFYYFLNIISRGVSSSLSNSTSIGVWLASYTVDLVLVIFYLLMVKTITKALQIIAGESVGKTNEIELKPNEQAKKETV